MNKVHVFRKIGFFIVWYLLYFNLWFIILAPDIYRDAVFLTAIVLIIIISGMDTLIRPFTENKDFKEEVTDKYSLYLLVSFLLTPFLYALAYHENKAIISQYIGIWDNPLVSYAGLVTLAIGGMITVLGRYQLGKFGSGVLVIEDDHDLITEGIFKYIRNPIYAGGLLGLLGFMLSLRSMFLLVVVFSFNFWIFNVRMKQEERLLLAEFGEKYEEYMKRTKKLIPYVY